MKFLPLMVFLALNLFVSSADAQDNLRTVRELLSGCEGVLQIENSDRQGGTLDEMIEDAHEWGVCTGFVHGVTAVLAYSCWSKTEGFSPLFAADAPPSTEASIQAFVNWARDNPQMWSEAAEDGVLAAVAEAWPCTN